MTLLDDAKRLDNNWLVIETISGRMVCRCCEAEITSDSASRPLGHASDCPWLSMPKIVALLEAFERHSIGFDEHEYEGGVVLSIGSECCCFAEPVIHTEGRCMLPGGAPKWSQHTDHLTDIP